MNNSANNDNGRAKGKPLEHWHKVLTNTVCNGERNATLTSVCGKLLHAGVKDIVLLFDLMLCVNTARCEEPLAEDEVRSLVTSVVQTHLKRLHQ